MAVRVQTLSCGPDKSQCVENLHYMKPNTKCSHNSFFLKYLYERNTGNNFVQFKSSKGHMCSAYSLTSETVHSKVDGWKNPLIHIT